MPGHLSTEQAERFYQRNLSPAELVTTYDHIALCEDCRQLLRKTVRPESALTSLLSDLTAGTVAEPAHLSYETLSAYVDNCLDEVERENAQSHLEVCATCAAESR